MQLQYNRFYIEHGIRTPTQLIKTKQNDLSSFTLPVNSVMHYTVRDEEVLGISDDDPLMANLGERVLADYVTQYTADVIGQPTKINRQFMAEIRSYVNHHKRFKWVMQSKSLVNNRMIPMVVNYSSIDRSYRYRQGPGVFFQRRWNYYNTVFTEVANRLKKDDRHHFILLDPPSTIPPISRLKMVEKSFVERAGSSELLDVSLRRFIDTDSRFMVSQFWIWCGEHPEASIISQIDESLLDRCTLLYTLNGHYVSLNLGVFNSWIKRNEESKGQFTPINAQRLILRSFMGLQQLGTLTEDVALIDVGAAKEMTDDEIALLGDPIQQQAAMNTKKQMEEGVDPAHKDININAKGLRGRVDVKTHRVDLGDTPDETVLTPDGDSLDPLLAENMDQDLEQLEVVEAQIEANKVKAENLAYQPYAAKKASYTDTIDQLAETLSQKGLMSAAEYRRAKQLARRYETMKSPWNPDETLESFIQISNEALQLQDTTLVKNPMQGVPDESVYKSSTKGFTSDYIKNVMTKDIANSIMHVQSAGVAVTDLSIKDEHTYLGSHQIISCQLTPLIGAPTTVKMKLPVIDNNGIFMANGVKYKIKSQRVDRYLFSN